MDFIHRKDRKNQFIFAGRLDKTKGITKLLTAWEIISSISNSENTPLLLICGTGPEENWCKDFINKHCLNDTVKLLGFLENSKTVEMIAESLALILPTQWYEGFPMTIVEAYGYGTPVIGSEIGNVGNLVIKGVTGYTFNQDYPEEIVGAVAAVLAEFTNGDDLYKNTLDHYNSHYKAEENYIILRSIYKFVMNR